MTAEKHVKKVSAFFFVERPLLTSDKERELDNDRIITNRPDYPT